MKIIIQHIVVILLPPAPPEETRIDEDEGRSSTQDPPMDTEDPRTIRCPRCGWWGIYDDQTRARKALGAHSRKCKGRNVAISPFALPFVRKK